MVPPKCKFTRRRSSRSEAASIAGQKELVSQSVVSLKIKQKEQTKHKEQWERDAELVGPKIQINCINKLKNNLFSDFQRNYKEI